MRPKHDQNNENTIFIQLIYANFLKNFLVFISQKKVFQYCVNGNIAKV